MELTIKEYAKKNRLSIYQVVKKLERGELEGVSKEIDGKKIQFIKETTTSSTPKIESKPKKESQTLNISREDIDSLKAEIKALREEIKELKEILEA